MSVVAFLAPGQELCGIRENTIENDFATGKASKTTSGLDESALSGRKIRIQFDLERNQVLEFQFDCEDIIDQIWYSGDEYIRMKATSREESRAWRRLGYSVLLKDTFEDPNPNCQEFLNAFVRLEEDLSRRGLERHLCRQHAEERSDRKDCARQAVFVSQERLARRGVKGEELVERIAQAYSNQCRQAEMFARRLAIADELVVKMGEDSSVAEKILEDEGVGSHRKMERRLSNYSAVSANSMDSRRKWGNQAFGGGSNHKSSKKCPSSPASPMEEYYAAIA